MIWTNCAYCGKRLKESTGYCDEMCMKKHEYEERLNLKGTSCGNISGSDDSWINGTWEHITNEPIKITGGRKELIDVCRKHGVMPKALMKAKSQGTGFEFKTRRY